MIFDFYKIKLNIIKILNAYKALKDLKVKNLDKYLFEVNKLMID